MTTIRKRALKMKEEKERHQKNRKKRQVLKRQKKTKMKESMTRMRRYGVQEISTRRHLILLKTTLTSIQPKRNQRPKMESEGLENC